MKNVRRKTVAVLFFLALCGQPLLASAQVTPQRGGQRQRLELERRLQQAFQRNIQNQLGLSQEAADAVQTTLVSFQEDRSELHRAQASLRHQLRDPALPDLGDDEALSFLQQMVDLQERELALYRSEQAELLEVLSPPQVLQFYRLRDNFGQRMNQLRQRRGQGGGQGGPGLGVPPGGIGLR